MPAFGIPLLSRGNAGFAVTPLVSSAWVRLCTALQQHAHAPFPYTGLVVVVVLPKRSPHLRASCASRL